jgi:integrase/recombinase XerD
MSGLAELHGWQIFDPAGRRKYLSGGERSRFLAAAEDLPEAERALCRVLVYAGCRISEALALTAEHVDADRMALRIRTLKRRQLVFRVVPVPEMVVAELLRLAAGKNGRLWPMHRATAWRLVKGVMRRASIQGPMACPKGLRHGFGMRAAGSHVPASLIQRWMGHASPETTGIYLDAVGIEERAFASGMWRMD